MEQWSFSGESSPVVNPDGAHLDALLPACFLRRARHQWYKREQLSAQQLWLLAVLKMSGGGHHVHSLQTLKSTSLDPSVSRNRMCTKVSATSTGYWSWLVVSISY